MGNKKIASGLFSEKPLNLKKSMMPVQALYFNMTFMWFTGFFWQLIVN